MKEIGRGGLMEQIRLHLGSKPDLVLFRNQGGAIEVDGRWQTYGLHRGASDLIGCLAGRFFALEVKTALGRLSEEQVAFIALIKRFGGYAAVARSVKEAEDHYLLAKHV